MALPSAPLGQLSSLNVPTSVPTVVTPGKEEFWKKALLGLLVNAAGTAVQGGVKNAMSQDHAAEFGQTPKSFLGRVGTGPQVGDAQAGQMRDFMGKLGLQELADAPGAQSQIAKSEAALDRSQRNTNQMQDRRTQLAIQQAGMRSQEGVASAGRDLSRELNTADNTSRKELTLLDHLFKETMQSGDQSNTEANIRLRSLLEGQDPLRVEQTRLTGAQADEAAAQSAMLARFRKAQEEKELAEAAKRNPQPRPTSATPTAGGGEGYGGLMGLAGAAEQLPTVIGDAGRAPLRILNYLAGGSKRVAEGDAERAKEAAFVDSLFQRSAPAGAAAVAPTSLAEPTAQSGRPSDRLTSIASGINLVVPPQVAEAYDMLKTYEPTVPGRNMQGVLSPYQQLIEQYAQEVASRGFDKYQAPTQAELIAELQKARRY